MPARKHYLDNLRSLCILLLFPFHVFMIYNNWGESFYIHGEDLAVPSVINQLLYLVMMPLLFTIAGISSRYALGKRSVRQYASERVHKLLLPLIFSMLLILPVQSYIAGLFHNGHANYFCYYTAVTDFTGYDGAFTPGHLWFILFLFVISMISLPLMRLAKRGGEASKPMPFWVLILLGLLPCLGNMAFDISGKSPTEHLAYFLLGCFALDNETVQQTLEKRRFVLLGMAVTGAALTFCFDHILYELVSWLAVLSALGFGRHCLNSAGRVSHYLSASSFGLYVFHQSWIVIVGYFVLQWTEKYLLQIPFILAASAALTFATHEAAKRARILRWMFGLKRG